MTNRPRPGRAPRPKTLPISLIAGTLLVPLSAFAATYLTRPEPADARPAGSALLVSDQRVLAETAPVSTGSSLEEDLAEACGPAGLELVALEEAGTISAVQQAALDALRGICDQESMPLPERPVPEPIVQTVIIPAKPFPSTTQAQTSAEHREDDDEHETEFEHEQEDEHEDEDEREEHD